MGVLRVKEGARFDRIDPAGFRLLGTLDRLTRELPYDLTVSCGSDHHPATNPHTLGRAYDVRTHDLTLDRKLYILRAVLLDLQEGADDAPVTLATVPIPNFATRRFFGQLEHLGTEDEHAHFQRRKGVTFP